MGICTMTKNNRDLTKQARKDANRFIRAVKKCQRELNSMKKSLGALEGEDRVESEFGEFEQDLEAMLDVLDEKMRSIRTKWLSASMINPGSQD